LHFFLLFFGILSGMMVPLTRIGHKKHNMTQQSGVANKGNCENAESEECEIGGRKVRGGRGARVKGKGSRRA
jgi:hypothetical protein